MVKAWADGVHIYYIKVRASAVCRYSFGEKAPQSHDVDVATVRFCRPWALYDAAWPLFSYSQHAVGTRLLGCKVTKIRKKKKRLTFFFRFKAKFNFYIHLIVSFSHFIHFA